MKNAGHDAQLGMLTLVVVVIHVAHIRRVMQPETEDRALYDVFFVALFGLVLGGAIVESVGIKLAEMQQLCHQYTLLRVSET